MAMMVVVVMDGSSLAVAFTGSLGAAAGPALKIPAAAAARGAAVAGGNRARRTILCCALGCLPGAPRLWPHARVPSELLTAAAAVCRQALGLRWL